MRSLRGFVLSFHFAPYASSPGIDLFKKVAHMPAMRCDVVHAAFGQPDLRLLDYQGATELHRHEVRMRHDPAATNPLSALWSALRWTAGALLRYRRHGRRADFVLSHSFSMLSHLPAILLKLVTRKPWIAYLGDPVRQNPYFEGGHIRLGALGPVYRLIERWTFRLADALVFTNRTQLETSLQGSAARYRGKAHVVEHCFDPRMFDRAARPPRDPERYQLCHVGAMLAGKRTARLVLECLDRHLDEQPSSRVHLTLVGGADEGDRRAHQAMRHGDRVRFVAPVDYFESLRWMQQADCLLLIDADFRDQGVAQSPFLPGKYAEYLGARRPILAVTMPRGAVADLQHELGYPVVAWDPEQLRQVLSEGLPREPTRAHLEACARFAAASKSAELAQVIRGVVG